jgi:hypothetical protein
MPLPCLYLPLHWIYFAFTLHLPVHLPLPSRYIAFTPLHCFCFTLPLSRLGFFKTTLNLLNKNIGRAARDRYFSQTFTSL